MSELPQSLTRRRAVAGAGLTLAFASVAGVAQAKTSAAKLTSKSKAALQQLYATSPKARELGAKSRAILVFPEVLKAGLMVGGQTGNGALLVKGRATAFYNTSAATFGLQAGAQKYGYALFFITESALEYLKKSDGWSIGSGPSVVLIDEGKARSLNTTTLTQDVYAMIFSQKGLMAGLGLEGAKITQIYPDP
jgi:lipid-binding SYLF domain-containing protein